MCEPCSECFVSSPFAGDGLEFVYVGRDLALAYVEVDARLVTELSDYGKERNHVVHRTGDERAFVCVPFTGEFEIA